MRVGLMADTHDRVPVIAEFVRVMQEAGVAMLIHAGDYCAPFSLRPSYPRGNSLGYQRQALLRFGTHKR